MEKQAQLKASRPQSEAAWLVSDLWRSLERMRIEPEGATQTFVAKLARESGWSRGYADAVFDEYRRFLYLAAVTGPVTPSEDVDRAWHLHLTYTRHYWEELCGAILRRPLHHEPTAGGRSEAERYDKQYGTTLTRYRDLFGVSPPASIWPGMAQRFAAQSKWVDASRYWLIPKRNVRRGTALIFASLPIAACTALAANTSARGNGSQGWVVGVLIAIVLLTTIAVYGLRQGGKRGDGGGGSGGCGGGGGGCSSGRNGDSDGSSGCGGGCGGD